MKWRSSFVFISSQQCKVSLSIKPQIFSYIESFHLQVNQTLQSNRWLSCFVFMMFHVPVPATLTGVSWVTPSLQGNARIVPQIRPWPPPSTSFGFHDLLITLPFYIWVRIAQSVFATGCGLDGPGSIPYSSIFFSSPQSPDWLTGPPSLLYSGYWGFFPWGECGRSVKLTAHLHLVLTSTKMSTPAYVFMA
jgi:hypothetical protein